MNLDFSFWPEYAPMLIEGTGITIALAALTVIFGTILGMLLAILRFNPTHLVHKIFAKVGDFYVSFFRGTPLMIQLYVLYFGLPQLGVEYPEIPGISTAFFVGVFSLSLNSAAYIAEIFRAGIMGVDKGQFEAGRSLGFNEIQTLRYIIMPQAIKNILPALGNEFISLIKESAIVSIIGIADIMYKGNVIRTATYRPFETLLVIAVVYYILTSLLSLGLGKLERRYRQDA